MVGQAEAGRQLFGKLCVNCHRLENSGFAIGPDLAALTSRSPESLLVAILDPSADIDGRYLSYLAVRSDGRSVTGVLAEETGTSITIVESGDKRHSILRGELEQLKSTGKSMMPDGIEKDLSLQDLANLLAYVMSAGARSK